MMCEFIAESDLANVGLLRKTYVLIRVGEEGKKHTATGCRQPGKVSESLASSLVGKCGGSWRESEERCAALRALR